MLASAADILPSISRREEHVSFFFLPPFNAWERARRAPLARAAETSARESLRPFLFSYTRTRVDDYVSEVALPNVMADGNSDLLGMDVKRILFSFFPLLLLLLFFLFLNPISDVYLHAFKSHRRVRGSRADRNIDSLIPGDVESSSRVHARYIYLHTFLNKQTHRRCVLSLSLLSAVKKILFLFLIGAAGRLTSRGLRHGSVGV